MNKSLAVEAAPAFGASFARTAGERQTRVLSSARPYADAAMRVPPLSVEPVLSLIMEMLGEGEGIYVACVCKEWRAAYAALRREEGEGDYVMTSYRSAVASLPRLQLACANGLTITREEKSVHSWPFCRAVVTCGNKAVLAFAREQGMLWSACA
eukprot:TRINITY_DN7474_c0_g1_i1.p1 TRINITY_DN7474_c0_g1~~TRINITY_DN7474_c0_g1_i1.p1  ORF type:complete len:178 (+),score=26.28 TRINITY_DN7474_c0_g1_i1:74-535(+)